MNGQKIIDTIISGTLLKAKCAHDDTHDCIVVWGSGAEEQLDTVCNLKQEKINDTAGDLYLTACSLMRQRYVKNDDQWNNLELAAMRFNAARQANSD